MMLLDLGRKDERT